MTDKRQKAAKVKCKRNESHKTVNNIFCGIQSSLEETFEFSWSSFADKHNTLPKLTNKFAFGTPWLPDLLCKHWFMSSEWNFCHWVADVPPWKTSLSGDEQGGMSAVHRLVMSLVSILLQQRCRVISKVQLSVKRARFQYACLTFLTEIPG